MEKDLLKHHVYATYVTLRYGLASMAVFFPMLLYLGGRLKGVLPQDSMSAYYFASATGLSNAPMRVWFIGLLFAIGTCLILYRGFSKKENLLLNIAGAAAICVAIFPMPWDCGQNCPKVTVHGISATVLFLCIATVSITCAKNTLHLIHDENTKKLYQRKYTVIGAIMFATPLLAFAFAAWLGDIKKYTFAIEAIGIWAFAYYWWTKSSEFGQTNAEILALNEQFEIEAKGEEAGSGV